MAPSLPRPRGPLSEALASRWQRGAPLAVTGLPPTADPLVDDDLHLALWCCYELHYGGFEGIDDRLEWDGPTLELRGALERRFERALRAEHDADALPSDPVAALEELATQAGPPLARTIEERGERRHLQEFAIHRSAYQLKEADPHTFGIPRLAGPGRAAMIEIQADEYGDGAPGEAHAELFAAAMDELGLCSDLGHYVDRLPGVTLATDNLVSMFGLHRRLRGALVGHLALFEMCSVTPMSRYLAAARRVGGLPALERFYAVHVEIDAHHARLALDEMVAPLAAAHPELGADITFGAAALGRVEARFAAHVLDAWAADRSSLRDQDAGDRVGAGHDPEREAVAGNEPDLAPPRVAAVA
jgi:hypothetical protein